MTSLANAQKPLVVYGSTASYYTGKLEAYLRAKGIPYRLEPFSDANMRRCARYTGVVQIPQVECADGSWLIDSTLIIEYFERVHPEPAVSPRDPLVGFISRLIEDYADEWLWRPAMHYRWSFPDTAHLMGGWLAEHLVERRAPLFLKRSFWRRRQHRTFVAGDGVDASTRAAVERCYLDTLTALEEIFARRPFVLGERPTEADFGFFASMFRHFFSDPAPARIMRERAPAVHEWVARMWTLRPERLRSMPLVERLPEDLGSLLDTVANVYVPYLDANAQAYAAGQSSVRYEVLGTVFTEPVKPYRVWCRDRLQSELASLGNDARAELARLMGSADAVSRLLIASPKPAESVVDELPLTGQRQAKAVDSWWR